MDAVSAQCVDIGRGNLIGPMESDIVETLVEIGIKIIFEFWKFRGLHTTTEWRREIPRFFHSYSLAARSSFEFMNEMRWFVAYVAVWRHSNYVFTRSSATIITMLGLGGLRDKTPRMIAGIISADPRTLFNGVIFDEIVCKNLRLVFA